MTIFNMLVGLPGSGKTHYAQEWVKLTSGAVIISSDDIRQELWGDANDQQNPRKVFDEMFSRTVFALNNGIHVMYDATNLSAKTRKSTLSRLRQAVKLEFDAICTVVTCSISECKRRQGWRDRKVPDEVIDRMVRQFQTPWYNEGWDTINVVNRGKMQNIAREHLRMVGEPHDNHHHTLSLERHCLVARCVARELIGDSRAFTERGKELIAEAAYHHDIGKHKTKAFLDSKGNPTTEAHFYNHDNVGAYLWISGDERGKWSTEEFLLIGMLIQYHMMPYFLQDKNGEYHINLYKWCNKKGFDTTFFDVLCILHAADKEAH